MWCALMLVVAAGCTQGPETDSFTFGPVDPTNTTVTTTTTGPIDPTTGGNVSMTQGSGGDTSTGDGMATGTASSGGDSTTGAAGPVCGDEVAEPGEECDGTDLAGLSCADVDAMYTGGTLACDPMTCTFDVSGCLTAENPIVVCQAVGGAITDNSTLSNTIVLAPDQTGATITDVNVEVELDHTYIGDLDIDVSMGGTSVLLFNSCTSENDLHVVFDDSGGALSCGSSNLGSTVQPTSPLSAYNGATVQTNWTLDIADTATADTGTLTQWCVTITWM